MTLALLSMVMLGMGIPFLISMPLEQSADLRTYSAEQ